MDRFIQGTLAKLLVVVAVSLTCKTGSYNIKTYILLSLLVSVLPGLALLPLTKSNPLLDREWQ